MSEVQLCLGTVLEHGSHQLLQLDIGGVLQLIGGILNGAVGSQLGVGIGAVCQFGINRQIDCICQVLGMDALRGGIVARVL